MTQSSKEFDPKKVAPASADEIMLALENADQITTPEENPFIVILKRFLRHKMAVFSFCMIVILFTLSLFVKQIAPFERDEIVVGNYYLPVWSVQEKTGRIHYLGTDNLGRDYFSRMLYAARISLSVAFITVSVSIIIGIVVGAISGFYGGVVDGFIMRAVDFLLTLPDIPILLIISSMLLQNENSIPIPKFLLNILGKIMLLDLKEARVAVLIMMVLAAFGWLGVARLMRGQVLALRDQPFVDAARSLGASDFYIIFRHLVPNAMAPIIVTASLALAGVLITEAILSFLGFGIQEPIPTWGNMLYATRQATQLRPWLTVIIGMPIFICSLAFNFIGDGLRDALDPRLKL